MQNAIILYTCRPSICNRWELQTRGGTTSTWSIFMCHQTTSSKFGLSQSLIIFDRAKVSSYSIGPELLKQLMKQTSFTSYRIKSNGAAIIRLDIFFSVEQVENGIGKKSADFDGLTHTNMACIMHTYTQIASEYISVCTHEASSSARVCARKWQPTYQANEMVTKTETESDHFIGLDVS